VRGAPHPPRFALIAGISFLFFLTACELVIKTNDLEGGCPRSLPGPSLVKIDSPSGAYCIDSTEITNGLYKDFVDAQRGSLQAVTSISGCQPVATLKPDVPNWLILGTEKLPAQRVNWCQAAAYCNWTGKRLCGKIGGGPLPPIQSFWTNPATAQWFNACSRGKGVTFPYGDTYMPGLCVDPASGGQPQEVTSKPGCQGGFPGLFDMSGNLWEMTDNCDGPGPNDNCHSCGGAYDSVADPPPNQFACSYCRTWGRTAAASDIGFRCCKDL
jgi:formylglycine-generating enzyme required for sulfatase activity